MVRFVLWRLVQTLLATWALASVVFLVCYRDLSLTTQLAMPDAEMLQTAPTAGPAAQQAARRAVQQRLGFGLPLFYFGRSHSLQIAGQWHWNGINNQYHRWATGLLRGDLGTSFRTGEPVAGSLGEALFYTVPLTGSATVLAGLIGVALAVRLAARPWWGQAVRAGLVALHAVPLFVVALALLLLLANPETMAWFPAYGLDQATEGATQLQHLAGYIYHLVLPVLALTLTAVPELTLQLEAALAQQLRSDYATTARAKGLDEQTVIWRHALRNAILPALTQLAELLPALVAGAVIVEVVFALPGMGRLLAHAAAAHDYPLLIGGVLLTSAARLLALLLTDLCYVLADPRIRWQS